MVFECNETEGTGIGSKFSADIWERDRLENMKVDGTIL